MILTAKSSSRNIFCFLMLALIFGGFACGNNKTMDINNHNSAGSYTAKMVFPAYIPRFETDAKYSAKAMVKGGIDCEKAGIEKISCSFFDADDTWLKEETWLCSNRTGVVDDIPAGNGFTVKVAAIDQYGTVLLEGEERDVTINPHQQTAGGEIIMKRVLGYYFQAANGNMGDGFGYDVALSADGTTLAIGAAYEDSGYPNLPDDNSAINSGAVYVYTRDGQGAWGQPSYLKTSNIDRHDYFGCSVALSADGNTLAVGADVEGGGTGNQEDNSAPGAGAVYIFKRTGTAWGEPVYIKASNIDENDAFGHSVALSADGNTLAVGAFGEKSGTGSQDDNSALRAGAVYVFSQDQSGAWGQPVYLKAGNIGEEDRFGGNVVLSADGNTLAVGALGESSKTGNQTDDSAYWAGAVYVFMRDADGSWGQPEYIKANNIDEGDQFGESIALSADGSLLAVGAHDEESGTNNPYDNSMFNSGAVYIYRRENSGVWGQPTYLKATNIGENNQFGESVALSADGSILAVGAPGEDNGFSDNSGDYSAPYTGAVYVFTRDGNTWSSPDCIKGTDTVYFGMSVSLSADGNNIAVGSPFEQGDIPYDPNDPTDYGDSSYLDSGPGAVYFY